MSKKLLGSIEAGGTKFVCSVGNQQLEVIEQAVFPTTTPEETMAKVLAFFENYTLEAIAVGSFGPIDLQKNSKTYGFITSTPKLAWKNFDFVGKIKQTFSIPVVWTTDVNAAAYGEWFAGSAKGTRSCVYYTVGTGIGAGAIQDGQFIEGLSHPEMGHMLVKKMNTDTFEGVCPYHKDCLEGIASGPAIEKRAGKKAETLEENDPIWELVANYLAQAVYNTTLILSPEKIILGGGVMKQGHLLEKVRQAYVTLLNDYIAVPAIDSYIVTPELEGNAATIGCLALAKNKQKD